MSINLNNRQRRILAYSIPVLAVFAALLFGAVMLVLLGANPVEGYSEMFIGAFGSGNALIATILKATPLLFVGTGIVIVFRANVINIGAEGQMVLGGLFATIAALYLPEMPSIIMVPAVLIAGLAGGALWGWIPGALKAYYRVNEILSTIMLNIVAVQLMSYLLRGPLIDPAEIERGTRIPQTERLVESADLPIIFGDRFHIGPLIAVLCAIATYYLLWRTPLGYRLRAVGLSEHAARYAGIPVRRTIALALTMSGALAGLAGAVLVFGSESHRMVTDGSTVGFTGSAGFNGIVAALLGAFTRSGRSRRRSSSAGSSLAARRSSAPCRCLRRSSLRSTDSSSSLSLPPTAIACACSRPRGVKRLPRARARREVRRNPHSARCMTPRPEAPTPTVRTSSGVTRDE